MGLAYDIISIGTLSRNRFWDESAPMRHAHATTTLIRDGNHTILVDPSLPAELLSQRLNERTGLTPDAISAVFLTTCRPVHRRSLTLFDEADWLMSATEIETMRTQLNAHVERADQAGEPVDALVDQELALLGRFTPAPEKLTPRVHLFPTPGPTLGSATLLLVPATHTIAVVGDVVVSRDYYHAGRVFEQVADVDQARESFREIIEIADQIIPGHDNLLVPAGGRA
jgi:glyoxylase-like metal-dependent hydrolase (beta-lactamase superfamily II)